jgi:ABC-type glycerol-3-phosphate transport system substrate-binding protein
MLNRKLVIFFALIFVTLQTFAEDKKESLKIAFLSADLLQINALSDLANKFEAKNPNIKLSIQSFSDESFKQKLPTWIETGEFDLLHWQAGERLGRLVDNELITPISSIIDTQNLANKISSSALKQVSYDGLIYGLPFAHYTWGFYYNLEIFSELDLTLPKTWEEFISISHTLKKHGVIPCVQANKD